MPPAVSCAQKNFPPLERARQKNFSADEQRREKIFPLPEHARARREDSCVKERERRRIIFQNFSFGVLDGMHQKLYTFFKQSVMLREDFFLSVGGMSNG